VVLTGQETGDTMVTLNRVGVADVNRKELVAGCRELSGSWNPPHGSLHVLQGPSQDTHPEKVAVARCGRRSPESGSPVVEGPREPKKQTESRAQGRGGAAARSVNVVAAASSGSSSPAPSRVRN